MAGLKVVPIKTHADGNLHLEDLRAKAEQHKENLAAFMVLFARPHMIVFRLTRLSRSPILRLSVSSSMVSRMYVCCLRAHIDADKFCLIGLQDHS